MNTNAIDDNVYWFCNHCCIIQTGVINCIECGTIIAYKCELVKSYFISELKWESIDWNHYVGMIGAA